MKKKKEKAEGKKEHPPACPVCELFDLGSRIFGKESEFFQHIDNAKMEILRAIKSLVDRRIESLEKEKEKRRKHRYSRIDVEE